MFKKIKLPSLLKKGSAKFPHSPSSSSLAVPANTEPRSHGTVHVLSSNGPSSTAQQGTVNVMIVGETGVGISSVINLIARRNVAKVSRDANGCTMEHTPYNISFDGMDFTLFDTAGIEEPTMGVDSYLQAIEKAFELIKSLEAAGGLHLLLFCMRGGRITVTTQSNYLMFYEYLCERTVPIALVFTGLETEDNMEDWWKRNEAHILHYGIKSQGHACITAVHDGTVEEIAKYDESREKIRDLIRSCALKSGACMPKTRFAKTAKRMMGFVKHSHPGRKTLTKTLTQRCKLAPDVAERIVDMMESSDAGRNGDSDEIY